MLGGVGPLELMIILVLALVVLGPKRLPQAGRSLGQGLRSFRRGLAGSSDEPESDEPDEPTALTPESHGHDGIVAPAGRA